MGFDLRAQDLPLLHRCLNKLRHECVVLEPASRGHCLAEWAHWGHREGPENALAAESVRASERHRVCEGLQADHAAQLAQEIVEAPERVEVCGSRADRCSDHAASPSPPCSVWCARRPACSAKRGGAKMAGGGLVHRRRSRAESSDATPVLKQELLSRKHRGGGRGLLGGQTGGQGQWRQGGRQGARRHQRRRAQTKATRRGMLHRLYSVSRCIAV